MQMKFYKLLRNLKLLEKVKLDKCIGIINMEYFAEFWDSLQLNKLTLVIQSIFIMMDIYLKEIFVLACKLTINQNAEWVMK